MKRALRYLNLGIIICMCCYLSGCSNSADQPDISSLTSESILGEDTQYAYLNQLLGGMSSRDMFDMLDNMMRNMNAAGRAGDATTEDYDNLVKILQNLYDWMDGTEPKTAAEEAAGSPALAMLDMMVENNVGDLMTKAVKAAGPDILTSNVYPMMAYVMACDKQIVDNAVDGITINDLGFDTSQLKKTEFDAMVNTLHGFLNKDNTNYKDIRAKFDALDAKIDEKGMNITVGDVKDIIPDMDVEDLDNLPVYIDALNALKKLYDEDPKIKEDVDKMMFAAGKLMNDTTRTADKHNAWDKAGMTDMERVLYCLQDILNSDPTARAKAKKFLVNVLNAVDGLDGADNIYGMMSSFASVYNARNPYTNNIPDLDQIDYAIYKALFQNNENRESCDPAVNTKSTAVRFSEMRTILLIFSVMDMLSDTLHGDPTLAIMTLITMGDYDKDGLKDMDMLGINNTDRSDILQFVVKLWGQSMFHYPQSFGSAYSVDSPTEYRPYPDMLKGTDWLWFNADVKLAGIPTPGLSWILNFVCNFHLTDYIMGLMTESMDCLVTFTGSTNAKYTTGDYHRMLSFAGPLIHYYGEKNYGSQLIHVIGAMNEVDWNTYKPMSTYGSKGTLCQAKTGTFFESIEGPYGYGLVYYLMRGASDVKTDNTADVADPAMDLLVRVLYKLNTTKYEDGNLLRALCTILTSKDWNPDNKTNQQLIDDLFEADGFIDNLYTFIANDQNHAALSQICATMGDAIVEATDGNKGQDDIFYASDVAGILQNKVLKKLGEDLPGNRTAFYNLVYNGLKQADVDPEVCQAAADVAGAICDKSKQITDDLKLAVPGMHQIYHASTVDYDYDNGKTKLQPLIDYLFDDINGQENPFVFNLKALGYKVTGIYDETYNTRSSALKVDDDTPVMDVVNHVVYDEETGTGIYDLALVTNFLSDLTDLTVTEDPAKKDVLWRLIDGGEAYDSTALNILEKILGDDLDNIPSWSFIRSMCLSYDGIDPIMLMVFRTVHLQDEKGQTIEFNGVLNDMSTFFHNQDFQPGTRLFDGIFNALAVVIDAWS